MSYDPRSIAFAAEILHPPQPVRADLAQSIHNALWRQPAFGYQNFQLAQDGVHLSNVPLAPGQISTLTFAWDRVILREEMRGTSVEDFATRVVNVVTTAFQTLSIPASLAQTFVVRSLIAPRNYRDGREFLGNRLFTPGADGSTFGRPLASLGARLVFPPTNGGRDSHQVRIETWPQDPRSIWIENTGSFALPIPAAEAPQLANHLYATYRFLTGPVCDFLGNLDTP